MFKLEQKQSSQKRLRALSFLWRYLHAMERKLVVGDMAVVQPD